MLLFGLDNVPKTRVQFDLGFDKRYADHFRGTRRDDPKLFESVISAVTVESDRFDLRKPPGFVDLKKSAVYYLDGSFSQRLRDVLKKIGPKIRTEDIDCEAFVAYFLGAKTFDFGKIDWVEGESKDPPYAKEGQAVRMAYEDLGWICGDPESKHYYIGLNPEDRVGLHVIGNGGPLAISTLDQIDTIYPDRTHREVSLPS